MDRKKCQNKAYNFQFASVTPKMLKEVGIVMVNIANNHSYDCYREGFESTKKYLGASGIDYIGDSELEKSFRVKTVDRKKIAFVGMDETIQLIPIPNFYPLIKRLQSENDYVVVHIHWGTEYNLEANEKQKDIGYSLIENGADLVIGHHPHVIESVEVYKGKIIFYSLGNFVFDQIDEETTKGIGVGVEFQNDKMMFSIYPYRIETFAPRFLEGEEKSSFCESYLKNLPHTECAFEIMKK